MGERLKVILKGDEANDALRLNDLVDQLDAIRRSLNHVERRVSGSSKSGLYYRVTSISMNSPLTLELEGVSTDDKTKEGYGSIVFSRFRNDIQSVISGQRPKDADLDQLESFKAMVMPLKRHISRLEFQFGRESVGVPSSLGANIDEILGPDQIQRGSLVGSLEVFDIHNDKNQFKIFPAVGAKSIKCHFSKALLPEALRGINHRVRIHGSQHFKKSEKFPHYMSVDGIDVLPDRADSARFSSLRGMGRSAFGTGSSTDFVEKVRSADW